MKKSPAASKCALQAVSTISSGDHRYQTSTAPGLRPVRSAIRPSSSPQPRSKHSQTSLALRIVPPSVPIIPNRS